MKKIISKVLLFFFLCMCHHLCNAGTTPVGIKVVFDFLNINKKLSYLNDIGGAEFRIVVNFEDFVGTDLVFTNHTVEAYDATDIWQNAKGDWAAIITPFRTAFKQSGFNEGVVKDEFSEDKYLYEKDGEFFGILGEKKSKSIDGNCLGSL